MYFVGIKISKYKHDCFIMTETGDVISNSFSISNNQDRFQTLLTILNSLDIQDEIRIEFEVTAHYTLNLKLFLEKAHYSFMEFNPILLAEFNKPQTLKRIKNDAIDYGFYYSLVNDSRLHPLLCRILPYILSKVINSS